MTMIAYIPIAVMMLGALLWMLSSNAKVQRMGEILFFVGAMWAVYATIGKTIRIG